MKISITEIASTLELKDDMMPCGLMSFAVRFRRVAVNHSLAAVSTDSSAHSCKCETDPDWMKLGRIFRYLADDSDF